MGGDPINRSDPSGEDFLGLGSTYKKIKGDIEAGLDTASDAATAAALLGCAGGAYLGLRVDAPAEGCIAVGGAAATAGAVGGFGYGYSKHRVECSAKGTC